MCHQPCLHHLLTYDPQASEDLFIQYLSDVLTLFLATLELLTELLGLPTDPLYCLLLAVVFFVAPLFLSLHFSLPLSGQGR